MKASWCNTQAGFSLIELMVTVAIVAILLAIAVPAYSSYVLRSHRVEARTALTDLAGREEKYYSVYNQYSTDPIALGYAAVGSGATFPLTVGSGYYTVSAAVTNAAGAPSTYTFTAVPVGRQNSDTQCLLFTINQLGVQTATTPSCWQR